MQSKLIAEGIGTFTLALAVLLSISLSGTPLATPVAAALVLTLFVYTIGARSGCHINPAVTLGLWSINKIKSKEAALYITAQVLGALLALAVVATTRGTGIAFTLTPESMPVFLAELVGALLFGFGIAAVVYGKVTDVVSGLVIGGSLLLGILVAAGLGSLGILNPAVAVALGSLSLSYILGSAIGVMLGMNLYRRFIS